MGKIIRSIVWVCYLLLIVSLGVALPLVAVGERVLLLTDLLFCLVAVLWLISLVARSDTFKWTRCYLFLAAYFAAMLLSAIFSIDPQASYRKLAGVAYLIGLAIITTNLVDSESRFRQLTNAWLIGAAFAIVIGLATLILFYVSPGNPLREYTTYDYGAIPVGNYPRLSSTFISASMFCNYLNVSLLMLLIAHKLGWLRQTLFIPLAVGIMICSIFTISAGLGGLFLAAGCWFWFASTGNYRRLRKPVMAAAIFVALTFFAMSFFALQPYPNAPFEWQIPGTSITLLPSARVLVWTGSLRTFADNFLTGVGLGMPSATVQFQNTDGSMSLLIDAHNVFLSVAAQAGVIGLGALLALCYYLLRIGFIKKSENGLRNVIARGLGIAFLTAFVYQGLIGAFEDARHLWVLIGMLAATTVYSNGVTTKH